MSETHVHGIDEANMERRTFLKGSMTAAALFGFSASHSFAELCLWGIPYGLGAGSVDAALNNFVALHYKSRHMSWLHCFWGIARQPGLISWAYAWQEERDGIQVIRPSE